MKTCVSTTPSSRCLFPTRWQQRCHVRCFENPLPSSRSYAVADFASHAYRLPARTRSIRVWLHVASATERAVSSTLEAGTPMSWTIASETLTLCCSGPYHVPFVCTSSQVCATKGSTTTVGCQVRGHCDRLPNSLTNVSLGIR